ATDRQSRHAHRRRYRHLALRPLRRLPAPRPATRCRRVVFPRVQLGLRPTPPAPRAVGPAPPRGLFHLPPRCRRPVRRQPLAFPPPTGGHFPPHIKPPGQTHPP